MKSGVCVAVLGAVALMSRPALAEVAAAPQFGITPENTNVSPFRGVESAPFIRWQQQYPFGFDFNSALMLDGRGVLYGPGLTPVSAATGQLAGLNIPDPQSSPAIDGLGNIYQWQSGRMHAYAPDGTHLWEGPPTNFTTGMGVKIGHEGTVYARGGTGDMFAFSRHGQLLWTTSGLSGHGPLMAIDSQDNTYIARGGTLSGDYTSYDSNGNHRWTVPWGPTTLMQPPRIGPDGNIYFSEDYGTVTVVRDPGTGAVVREFSSVYGGVQAIGADGRLYFCSYQNVRATDLLGNTLWESHIPAGEFFGDLAVDAVGNVYCTTETSRVYAYSSTGDELWHIDLQLGSAHSVAPVIGPDGTLYVMRQGHITAIGGVVPAPAGIALLATAALAVGRRRRA